MTDVYINRITTAVPPYDIHRKFVDYVPSMLDDERSRALFQRMDLVNRAREMGQYMGEKLHALKPKHPSIGEVRGLGLFWALEMVKDQVKKTPFNTKQDKVDGKVAPETDLERKLKEFRLFYNPMWNHFGDAGLLPKK